MIPGQQQRPGSLHQSGGYEDPQGADGTGRAIQAHGSVSQHGPQHHPVHLPIQSHQQTREQEMPPPIPEAPGHAPMGTQGLPPGAAAIGQEEQGNGGGSLQAVGQSKP